jgi:threonine/homoserine/homoserine lactone efflux protein
MTAAQTTAFLLFAAVAAGTPGPSNVMLAATGAQVGVLRGLPCLLGQTTGMGLMLFAVLSGLGSIVLGQPAVLGALHWGGALVLLWLSWRIATASATVGRAAGGRPIGYLDAAVFQWVNPKAWLVSASAAGAFLTAGAGGPIMLAALLGVLFILAALPSCFVWLAFGAAIQRALRSPRRTRTFNVAMGILLALSIFIVLR